MTFAPFLDFAASPDAPTRTSSAPVASRERGGSDAPEKDQSFARDYDRASDERSADVEARSSDEPSGAAQGQTQAPREIDGAPKERFQPVADGKRQSIEPALTAAAFGLEVDAEARALELEVEPQLALPGIEAPTTPSVDFGAAINRASLAEIRAALTASASAAAPAAPSLETALPSATAQTVNLDALAARATVPDLTNIPYLDANAANAIANLPLGAGFSLPNGVDMTPEIEISADDLAGQINLDLDGAAGFDLGQSRPQLGQGDGGAAAAALEAALSDAGLGLTEQSGRDFGRQLEAALAAGRLTPPQQSLLAHSAAMQIGGAVQVTTMDSEVSVQLDPPELGTVQIKFSFAESGVSAQLMIDNEATKALLKSHEQLLRDALAQAGFENADLSFADYNGQMAEGEQDGADSRMMNTSMFGVESEPMEQEDARAPQPILNDLQVDIRV